MNGKGKLSARNWDISDHNSGGESMSKPVSSVPLPGSNASGYHQAFLKMSSYTDRNHMMIQPNSQIPAMEYPWVSQRNFLSETRNITRIQATEVSPEMIDIPNMTVALENTTENGETETKPPKVRKQQASTKKVGHVATKSLRPKELKKPASVPRKKKESSVSVGKREKRTQDNIEEGEILDYSGVPAPVCSCTGVPRQCYRWGAGGWQSSCCTTSISEYPLPMSTSRPGARLAGRKMSISAYRKLLHRLASEGHDLSYAVDLKNHWARHGTNKFVTIR